MGSNEEVLAFPRKVLDEIGRFNGFRAEPDRYLDALFRPGLLRFVPRDDAEKDFSLKQLIPYVLIASDGKILFYVRGKGSGESRLRLKGSVGIGGHINSRDEDLFQEQENRLRAVYNAAVDREVREELKIEGVRAKRIVGVINDDSNEVGKVHFGVVHLWELEGGGAWKAEKAVTRLEFLAPGEILSLPDVEVESWSRFCLEKIGEILAAS
jgi:predicted NUDIX family phosphoesterase